MASNTRTFLFLTAAGTFLSLVVQYFLISDTLYFNSLSEKLGYEQIQDLLTNGEKWAWLGYALIPIIYAIKCSLVALCLGLGCFFITNRFEFKKLFGVAVAAEFVFLIPAAGKLLWFLFIQTDYTLEDLQLFYPLSALSLFDYHAVQPWLLYPLQVLNVLGGAGLRALAGAAPARPQPRHERGSVQLRYRAGDLGGGGDVFDVDVQRVGDVSLWVNG